MKNILKTLTGTLGALVLIASFQNCKKVTIDGKDVIIIDVDPKRKYDGELKKVSYSDGGWYGIAGIPNYNAYLKLEVNAKGQVEGDLKYVKQFKPAINEANPAAQYRECTAKSLVATSDFKALENSILDSATKKYCADQNAVCAQMIDGGVKTLTTTDLNDKSVLYHMRDHNDMMMPGSLIFVDPAKVQSKVDSIIEKLKASSDCEGVISQKFNFKSLKYSVDQGFEDISNHPEVLQNLSFPQTFQKLDWKIEATSSGLYLSGTSLEKRFSSARSYTVTRRNFSQIRLSDDLSAASSTLKIIEPQTTCAIAQVMPQYNMSPAKLSITDLNNNEKSAGFGCWNSPQVSDVQSFVVKVNNLISSLKN